MTGGSFDRTIRGESVRVGDVEIVPVWHSTGYVGVSDSGVWGAAGAEPVRVEITTPRGTETIEL